MTLMRIRIVIKYCDTDPNVETKSMNLLQLNAYMKLFTSAKRSQINTFLSESW